MKTAIKPAIVMRMAPITLRFELLWFVSNPTCPPNWILALCDSSEALGARDIVSKLSKHGLELAVEYPKCRWAGTSIRTSLSDSFLVAEADACRGRAIRLPWFMPGAERR
jgi:hypothetical protein